MRDRQPRGDDHPNRGQHVQCHTNHGGRGVRAHCRRGCAWPCPEATVDPTPSCSPEHECVDRSEGPGDLCDLHLREYQAWRAAKRRTQPLVQS